MFYLAKIFQQGSGELIDLLSLTSTSIRDRLFENLQRCFGNVPLSIYLNGATYILTLDPETSYPVSQASIFCAPDYYYLYNVCTIPEYQRKGLMLTLLSYLLLDIPEGSRVILRVLPSNISAILLYQSLGFKMINEEFMEFFTSSKR